MKSKRIVVLSTVIVFLLSLSFTSGVIGGAGHSGMMAVPATTHSMTKGGVPTNTFITQSKVDVSKLYKNEPAPMGIADFGIGPSGSSYSYNSSSFEGIINVNSLSTYNSSLNPDKYYGGYYGLSFQLNTVLTFSLAGKSYVYWTQDVVLFSVQNYTPMIINNIWNFSSSSSYLHPGSISGNGTLYTTSNSPLQNFYIATASHSLQGSYKNLTANFTLELRMTASLASGKPQVAFQYNDGFGWQTFDTPVFTFAEGATIPVFLVDGNSYTPLGTYYDSELILGGPAGSSNTSAVGGNLSLQLMYWNGHNYQNVPNAFNHGSDTAEGINNVAVTEGPASGGVSPSANMGAGTGSLGMIYNSSSVSFLNVNVLGFTSGSLLLNGTSYQFTGSYVNVTIMPGTYDATIVSSNQIYRIGNFTISAGQTLNLFSGRIYQITFTETGLPYGTAWSVKIYNYSGIENTFSSKLSTLSFGVQNGTYSYSVSSSDSNYVNSTIGQFTINGSDHSTISVVFQKVNVSGFTTGVVAIAIMLVALIGIGLWLRRRK
ncbi:MAG: thermopsin [Thermoplasmataceae archaeon]